jgi:FtsP/CotA-like multicopper oxidase with cupredoxin domain
LINTSNSTNRERPRGATRREFIKYAGAGVIGVGLGGSLLGRSVSADSSLPFDKGALSDIIDPCFDDSPVAPPFSAPLPIAPAIGDTQGLTNPAIRAIPLAEQRGEHEFIPGIRTPIWGYNVPSPTPIGNNGIFPGPTICARKLQPLDVTFTNQLPPNEEPNAIVLDKLPDPEDHPFLSSSTVVHLHGINSDMVSDGYPENRREQGGTQIHHYPNNEYQRPASLWYHDHSVHITSVHLYRGLSAFYLLTDEIEDHTRLPGTLDADPGRGYGFLDIPLVFKDVMIAPREIDGRPPGVLIYNNCSAHGAYGDVMTVNGKQQPFFQVANRKYRFRTLNGSDARQYAVAIRRIENLKTGPNEPFFLIGGDQGLFPGPAVETAFFHTAVAERWEFVFDFSRYPVGQRLVMVNLLIDPDNQKLFPMMAFDVTRVEPDPSIIPPVLRPPGEHPADAEPPSRKRFFLFNRSGGDFTINSRPFDPARVDARPILDTTEQWTLANDSGGWGHPVHIHLGRFRVVRVQGRAPRPGELEGFKDVVWVGPNQTIDVIHQFWNFTGRFVFHCHNGSHEDEDMMSQFEVEPG